MDRELVKQVFTKVLKNEKNCDVFERYVYDKMKNTDLPTYRWVVYQVAGMLLKNHDNMREIAKDVKRGKIGWNSDIYEDVSKKLQEFDEYLTKPFEVVEGVVQCGKCGSKKTWSVQKQTRSSDEPMTTFSRCVECQHQWAYAG